MKTNHQINPSTSYNLQTVLQEEHMLNLIISMESGDFTQLGYRTEDLQEGMAIFIVEHNAIASHKPNTQL